MPKRQRLSRADFASIRVGTSRRFFGIYFSLSATSLATSHVSETKCACVVSKKAVKKAADRNLIKRRCREACRMATKNLTMPIACVFYAKKEATEASYAEIAQDIKQLIAQAKEAHRP